QPIDQLLEEFCAEAELNPLAHAEYTLARGRADAVFNRLVIEYERPGTLSDKLSHRATAHAVEQVKRYLEGLAQRQRHELTRMAGIVFDGRYIVFVRYRAGNFQIEPPASVSHDSLERFLYWLTNTASGIALTAENLNRDFSIEQLRTQNILRALAKGLKSALDRDRMVNNLFEQWRMFFSQSIDYSEAFGGRKLESLKKWVRKAGLTVNTPEEAERFFFALHTYFALLVKLIAWLALSRHLAVKLGVPSFGELISADSDTLHRRLRELEEGGIFRAFGLTNLLEGDFFAWYLFAWDKPIEDAIRELLKRLDEYDPATLSIHPEESRDLFKKLYHYLLPREIRHNLGEYYTPDWLAQRLLNQVDSEFFTADPHKNERRLREKLLNTRWLDPACGSGTFLVLIIARMKELGRALFINETELLNAILRNVVGFDLNPLAVLTARVNYLLAIADLLEHRRGEVTIPVYLADSVRTPAMGETLLTAGTYEFPTAIGTFLVPAVLCTKERFDRFCNILDESVRAQISPDAFVSRIEKELKLAPPEWQQGDADLAREVYERILNLHRQGMNGLWARLLKNNFAPLTVGQFDYIVGNPPWVNWEHLPDGYRQSIAPLWVSKYQLFPHRGFDAILGKSKDDISILMTYVVADKLLKDGGKLGFVITQSVFKTAGGGQGFRQFRIPQPNGKFVPLRVLHVDDMVALQPFEGASNRTAVMVLEKGRQTTYPVPYTVWRKVKGARFTYDSTLEEVINATVRLNFNAEPVDPSDPTSPWLTARPKAIKAVRKVLGKSDYVAHAGAYTGGANAVYWVNIVLKRPDGLVVVRNITEGAKVKVDEVTEPIEPDLLYPLLRGRDVQRWKAQPSAWILMVQDPEERQGYDEEWLQENCPRTYGYLKRFEEVLRERAAFKRYFTRKDKNGRIVETGPFYSMFDVGTYTFAPWKVVWPNIASALNAAVVGLAEGKVVVPQHIVTLVACETEDEAHYICALINSSSANFTARAYSQEGGKSFGDPHILEHIRIPRFDPKNPVHCRLAELSMQAHEAAKIGDEMRLREIEAEIDRWAAKLWNLTDDELRDIQQSLAELSETPEPADEE
ncbi:Eco57I restriction-modification methylase domain-containing protein, partial [Fervidibacter sp.]